MKNKSLIGVIMIGALLMGCNQRTSSETSEASSMNQSDPSVSSSELQVEEKISEQDKIKPETSSFQYEDYSDNNDNNFSYDTTRWYRNDLKTVNLPDPDVIEGDDGRYYVYGTTDRTSAQGLDCYATDDFNNYQLYTDIYKKSSSHWAYGGAIFAPEIRKIDDQYYMYISDYNKATNRRSITVVVADNPYGPYIDYVGVDADGNELDGSKQAIFKCLDDEVGFDVLDQDVFVDDDGEMYMYFSIYQSGVMQYIVGVKMKDPVTVDMSTWKILIRPGEASALTTGTNSLIWEAYKGFKVAEGPYMLKSPVNDKYYLAYTVNHYPDRFYSVCYAVSDEPLGTFEKPYDGTKMWKTGMTADADHQWTNLLFGYAGGMATSKVCQQWGGFMSGTGHNCFFQVGDEYYIGYHAHKNREDSNGGRAFAFDRLRFDEDGVPYTLGPSDSLQPLPSKISGYRNIAPEARVLTENVTNASSVNDQHIVEHYNLSQEKDKEVILGSGRSYIQLRFDKKRTIGGLSVYNSATFSKIISQIEYIDFGNGNVILNPTFLSAYVNDEKEFVFPASSFHFEFSDIETDKITLGFEASEPLQINEIEVYGATEE